MPVVTVQMWSGRTTEQKRKLVRAITDAMVTHANCKPDILHVIIQDVPKDSGRAPACSAATKRRADMALDAIDIKSAALLVIDMQNGFLHEKGTLGISGVDTRRLIDDRAGAQAPGRTLPRRRHAGDLDGAGASCRRREPRAEEARRAHRQAPPGVVPRRHLGRRAHRRAQAACRSIRPSSSASTASARSTRRGSTCCCASSARARCWSPAPPPMPASRPRSARPICATTTRWR